MLAADEKAWTNIEVIKKRAERGSRKKFLKALSKVPEVEPDEFLENFPTVKREQAVQVLEYFKKSLTQLKEAA